MISRSRLTRHLAQVLFGYICWSIAKRRHCVCVLRRTTTTTMTRETTYKQTNAQKAFFRGICSARQVSIALLLSNSLPETIDRHRRRVSPNARHTTTTAYLIRLESHKEQEEFCFPCAEHCCEPKKSICMHENTSGRNRRPRE